MPTTSPEPPGAERGDHVGAGDDADHGGRRSDRLAQALDDEEDDERLQPHEGELPEGVGGHEGADVGALADEPQDAGRRRGASRGDRGPARSRPPISRTSTTVARTAAAAARRNGSGVQTERRSPPATSATPRPRPAHDALPALRAALVGGGHELGEERLVRRVVDVVADEEERDERDRLARSRARRGGSRAARRGAARRRARTGMRRPRRVRVRSESEPIRSGRKSAKAPSAPTAIPIAPADEVVLAEEERRVGREDADPEREREGRKRQRAERAGRCGARAASL